MSIFLNKSLDEISSLFKKNELKYIDLFKGVEGAINKHENRIHSFTTINLDRYETLCNSLDEGRARQDNVLHGMPVGVKDIFNTKDFPTQMGSEIWKNFSPGNNARCVESLINKGSIVLGKTVTAEFAVHELNETKNPHNLEHTPGTSSSGSAVAVACGIVPYALATQTAGSISRPSSFCGVWGMKPSFGLIPRTGVLKTTDSLDTVGFISTHGENLVHILNALRVSGPDYPFVYKNIDCRVRDNNKIKIGYIKTYTWDSAEEYVVNAIKNIISEIEGIEKIQVEEIILPEKFNHAHEVHERIYNKSLAYYFQQESKLGSKISTVMKKMIDDGNKITIDQYVEALKNQEHLAGDLSKNILKDYDMVISIGTASTAPKRNITELPDPSLIWTLCHIPSVSIPLGRDEQNLPFGIQFISKRWGDYQLLELVKKYINAGILKKGSMPILSK